MQHVVEGGVEVQRAVEVVENKTGMSVPFPVLLEKRFRLANAGAARMLIHPTLCCPSSPALLEARKINWGSTRRRRGRRLR